MEVAGTDATDEIELLDFSYKLDPGDESEGPEADAAVDTLAAESWR